MLYDIMAITWVRREYMVLPEAERDRKPMRTALIPSVIIQFQ